MVATLETVVRREVEPQDAPVLDVRGLTVAFGPPANRLTAVTGVDLVIPAGRTLALVGESGSGKSVTSLAVMRLLAGNGRITDGQVLLRGRDGAVRDLAMLDEDALERVRGNDVGMVFQEPMTSLNPVFTVGEQIAEPIRTHMRLGRRAAADGAVALLDRVGIPDPARRARQYPHELSGGMRQRVTIAIALACGPALLLADEPTTALDVTVQAQILELIQHLQEVGGMGVLFVTHNLGVVASIAHEVAVMYAGQVVERGAVRDVLARPRHPYTQGLLACVPRLGTVSALKRDGGQLFSIPGVVPSLRAMPDGCRFAARCPHVRPACEAAPPPMLQTDSGTQARCIRWNEI